MMEPLQALGIAVWSSALTAGIFWQPRWMHRLMARLSGAITAVFYRGRHHKRAPLPARPFDERHPRPTVETIAARIRREAREAAYGRVTVRVVPLVEPFAAPVRAALLKATS